MAVFVLTARATGAQRLVPELACMYSVNAGYFLQDYNIVLTGIK